MHNCLIWTEFAASDFKSKHILRNYFLRFLNTKNNATKSRKTTSHQGQNNTKDNAGKSSKGVKRKNRSVKKISANILSCHFCDM